ncbi:MAG: asparaginase [Ilumatobacter sp.]|uniref:asparaginase n=1 Tax=Ilumatobacter sp. TaxID=1967498 RepID=UPI00261C9FE3|nr:asparaginase [Ilumatobacter sp.]MDJ0767983.1 asparaginase [Ilumatobacter sp.]
MNERRPRTTPSDGAYEPVAISSRSGYDESVHHGAAVALDRDGGQVFSVGESDVAIYPRSSNKPMQADAMLGLGLILSPEQLAVACASHDGTDRHVAVVRSTLAEAGLGDEALANTPDLPIHKPAAEALLAGGGRRVPIRMNCSGKHAAMVATCVANHWPIDGYLDPAHPLQVAITGHIERLAGHVDHIGVDGCGAPAHVVTLAGLARAFRSLAIARGDVWAAMTSHPDLVGGDTRDVTRIMRRVPGLMAKDGAEGMFAAALPDGRAAAVKIADGASRPAGIVLAATLRTVGVDVDPTELGDPVLGHGEPVGTIRPVIG